MQLEDLWEKIQQELSIIKADVSQIKEKTNHLEQKVDGLEQKVDGLEQKMDIMTNVNMAQILEQQTQMRQELNDKIDKYVLQNNLEHKQFAYQIARLETKNGILAEVG